MSSARHKTREDRNALITAQRVTEAVTAVIDETPTGAAGGTLYAALTAYLGLDQFEAYRRPSHPSPMSTSR